MPIITIRLPNKVVDEVGTMAQKLCISRSEYIRKSIDRMNKRMHELETTAKLMAESKRLIKESMA